MVPLHELDGVGREHAADLLEQVSPHLVAREVEHLLVPVQQGSAVAGGQDPVGVVAVQVGVGVDHLRLDPEAELHAEAAHVLDERAQPLGPHGRVDAPVAEADGVVAALHEPAVVEHEPLDADGGRAVGDRGEPAEVVVEVDGLPAVQHHRLPLRGGPAACAGGRAGRPRARPDRRRPRPRAPRASRSSRRARAGARPAAAARRRRWWCRSRGRARRGAPSCRSTRRAPRAPRRTSWRSRREPSTARVGAPSPGRPVRASRSQSPSVSAWRCGCRSCSWRPVKSSTSTRWSGSGHHDLETVEEVVLGAGVGQHVTQAQRATGQRLGLGHQLQARGLVGQLDAQPGRRPAAARCR